MKILIVSPKFHPIVGGGETFVLNSLEQLHNYGDDVHIAVEPNPNRNVAIYPYSVHEIAGLSDSHLNVISSSDGLYELIHRLSPDVIHVHGYFALLAVSLANSNNLPVIASIHSTPVWGERIVGGMAGFDQEKTFAEKIIKFSKPKILTAANDVYEKAAVKLAGNNTSVVIFPYPIKNVFFESQEPHTYRNKLGIMDNEVLITVPSRVIERKGIREAVHILELLPDNYKLCLPSSINPQDKAYWDDIVKSSIFKKVRNRIVIPDSEILHDDMPGLYAATDIVCMPSYYEGAPVATVEAMASMRPFVGYDSQGINGFIKNGVNGLLVPSKSVDSLADAVIKLSSNPELARSMAKVAHENVSHLSWERQLPILRSMYKSVM